MCALLIDAWQDRLQYPDLRPKVIEEYETVYGEEKDGKRVDLILVEDKSAGISLIQDLQRAHVPVRAYNPGRADKVQRLSIVANIIRAGRIWIPESSARAGYVRDWAEGFVSQICSFPDTSHDDFVDACVDSSTQVTMADGSSKRIDQVVVGDMVKTPNGGKKVTAVFVNGIKELWSVQVGDKTLLATANHKIFTDRGWVRVDSLNQSIDNGYILKGDDPWHSKSSVWRLSRLSSMVGATTDTLKATTRRIVNTLLGLADGFTGMFGSITMALFKRGCTSTTLMETQPTMTSPTLSASAAMNTGNITRSRSQSEAKHQSIWNTSTGSGHKPLNGTNQTREGLGIGNTPKHLWQRLGAFPRFTKRSRLFASGADRQQLPKAQENSFVVQPAKTPSPSSALVKQVVNTHSMRLVYDLTVEDEHCYFANDILVHNCTQALRYLRDAGWLVIDAPSRDWLDDEDYADAGRKKRENPYAL
jgi:predicted phage terminase large subunit-like protein